MYCVAETSELTLRRWHCRFYSLNLPFRSFQSCRQEPWIWTPPCRPKSNKSNESKSRGRFCKSPKRSKRSRKITQRAFLGCRCLLIFVLAHLPSWDLNESKPGQVDKLKHLLHEFNNCFLNPTRLAPKLYESMLSGWTSPYSFISYSKVVTGKLSTGLFLALRSVWRWQWQHGKMGTEYTLNAPCYACFCWLDVSLGLWISWPSSLGVILMSLQDIFFLRLSTALCRRTGKNETIR